MSMHMFQQLIDTLKKDPRKIVFTEGTDPRILEASARLLAGNFLTPILVGSEQEVHAAAEESGRRQSTPPHRPTDATARAGCAVRSTVTGSRTTKRPRNINNRFPKVCRTRRVPYHRQQYLPRQRRRPPLPGMTEQRNIRLKSISGGPASPKNGRMRCSSSQSSHSPSR